MGAPLWRVIWVHIFVFCSLKKNRLKKPTQDVTREDKLSFVLNESGSETEGTVITSTLWIYSKLYKWLLNWRGTILCNIPLTTWEFLVSNLYLHFETALAQVILKWLPQKHHIHNEYKTNGFDYSWFQDMDQWDCEDGKKNNCPFSSLHTRKDNGQWACLIYFMSSWLF